ncbi:MAG: DUF1698 domain-containing protein [Solirubrobacteraceae bacterium]|nr:DUF1698 domain-containing protein [Solirubrobacteraceae bacterium]
MDQGFPSTPEEFYASALGRVQWYYNVEVLPGLITRGTYPENFPMLPRMMSRKADVAGQHCLDIGSMDGLMPTSLARRGAARVVASDAVSHCHDRLAAVQHYYGVDFEFAAVGLLYDLHKKLAGHSFDFINFSGVLYHVYSPLMALASARSLLRRNGMMVVSTNIVYDPGFRAEFNDAGRLQPEANTFWYLTIPLLDYMLRMLKLAPVDCLHLDHRKMDLPLGIEGLRTGYMSILCRAQDDVVADPSDVFMHAVRDASWEHAGLTDWAAANSHPVSTIRQLDKPAGAVQRPGTDAIDLWATVLEQPAQGLVDDPSLAHTLRLADQS